MNIAFTNKSTKLKDTDGAKIVQAINLQLPMMDVFYGYSHTNVQYIAMGLNKPVGNYYEIAFLDNADQAGALGYHDVSPQGVPYGRIFVETVLSAGGGVLTGELSVSVTASHEALETVGDPGANLWADTNGQNAVAYELCDPVENYSYTVMLPDREMIAVSDFVLPNWFISGSEGPYDFLHKLTKPFEIAPGGYAIVENESGESQKTARMLTGDKLESSEDRDERVRG